jgi:class 3 adenylate cyclase
MNKFNINLYYSFADMISKMIVCIIVDDYNEAKIAQLDNMDLQSIQFLSYMIKYIKKYKNENIVITPQCSKFINFTTDNFLVKIPQDKTILEQELLKKILPLNFDKKYIENININSNNNAKSFNMICILFTDIVNYTELAKKYDDKIIFQLLYNVYILFDNIIKKYSHLQKIETIGDAYMVVGDIFRNSINHKIVVKEIILFALDIVKEIKTIKTPDDVQLSIRIGINMGNVSIGILGKEIPRLCVVGNAVNMASRLQSTAEVDTIQFSSHIYEQIQDIEFDKQFEIIIKENIFLKNMGSVKTYNIQPQKK